LRRGFLVHFGPTDLIKRLKPLSETAVREVRACEVRRQIVPDLWFSCTERSVAEIDATDEWAF